jgi:transglutaminase-like putative cysteine protease
VENQSIYLKETEFLDFNHPKIDEFLSDFKPNSNATNCAVDLYYKVRDSFLYDPYHLNLRPEALKASAVISKKRAWCVEKSTLLAALARKFQIPSRLGYAVVTNHIGVEKLTEYLKREEIVFHGYVELFLDGKWVKCTPAFDRRICRVSGVPPLEWDGKSDALFQAFIGELQWMEYSHFYGTFEDVPVELMNLEMKKYYPHLFETEWNSPQFSFKHGLQS